MNEKFKSFVNEVGVLCETWTIIYRNFIGQGMDAKEAMTHTQGFMVAFLKGITGFEGDKK
jgi:hypothetical protein